jgi:zinc-binding alcohol dehydrogenase family protein
MKAVGYYKSGPISAPDSLVDLELPVPEPGPRDLRVRVHAVSMNPVDTKVRVRSAPPEGQAKVLGFDASGVVEAAGSDVTLFRPGDEVFYAGALQRPGTNSEFHLVDERIVGLKPATLSHAEAAAMPLTSLTAWELLFDRMRVPFGDKTSRGTLLVINGAGGVGSILIQIARRLTGLRVVATASRPETIEWVRRMGAHDVIDHRKPLDAELKAIGIEGVEYVAGLTASDRHAAAIAELVAPEGHVVLIDDPDSFDIVPFKRKSVTVGWELMFTRSLYDTATLGEQGRILNEVSGLLDAGLLRTTLAHEGGAINAANLKRLHENTESGSALGKQVLVGF